MKPVAFPHNGIFYSGAPDETEALGEALAGVLRGGNVVARSGGLGAGKTTFTRGIARGLGIEEETTSPTYTIISEYEGALHLNHIDAYRLGGERDFYEIGGEEVIGGGGVSVIEWPEKISGALPAESVTVNIRVLEDGRREIAVHGLAS
jgi:tRNA threonylcarbamoyladenosine biosynthesis protein TsaE